MGISPLPLPSLPLSFHEGHEKKSPTFFFFSFDNDLKNNNKLFSANIPEKIFLLSHRLIVIVLSIWNLLSFYARARTHSRTHAPAHPFNKINKKLLLLSVPLLFLFFSFFPLSPKQMKTSARIR